VAKRRQSLGRKFATKPWRESVVAKIIELSPGARSDFDESIDWYSERSVRAAEGFADAVEEAFDKILAAPERFSTTAKDCRYCKVKRYPFRVIFS